MEPIWKKPKLAVSASIVLEPSLRNRGLPPCSNVRCTWWLWFTLILSFWCVTNDYAHAKVDKEELEPRVGMRTPKCSISRYFQRAHIRLTFRLFLFSTGSLRKSSRAEPSSSIAPHALFKVKLPSSRWAWGETPQWVWWKKILRTHSQNIFTKKLANHQVFQECNSMVVRLKSWEFPAWKSDADGWYFATFCRILRPIHWLCPSTDMGTPKTSPCSDHTH